MNCSNCKRHIPADAQFCIYCAARITPATPMKPNQSPMVQVAPATGPTTRLGPEPSYTIPSPPPAPIPVAPAPMPRYGHRRPGGDPSGPVFLIGLGVLVLTGWFWPGILILLGITALVKESARGRQHKGWQALAFFSILALLLGGGGLWHGVWMFWPLLLLWGLLSMFGRRGWRRW